MTLSEFLLARLAEDEATALLPTTGAWSVGPGSESVEDASGLFVADEILAPPVARHIARHDPARVLAEVAAKRQIVEMYRPNVNNIGAAADVEFTMEEVCWLLAQPYAEHPDFDEEWRV